MFDTILWILAVIGAFVILALLGGITLEWFEITTANRRRKQHMKAARSIAASLDSTAYWFSEDQATQQLIDDFAYQLREYGSISAVDGIRRNWRERRKL